jgi:hypothetical protein
MSTYNDIKDQIARVASSAGLTAESDRLKARITAIQNRLGYKGKWDGCMDQLEFAVYDRLITLPLEYETLEGVAVSDNPLPMMPKWYEFLDHGPGPQDDNPWVNVVIRRGFSPVVRQSYDEARVVRAFASVDERVNGETVNIRVLGYDENDVWVRTEVDGVWQDGENLALNGHLAENWAESVTKFKRITRIDKPVTNGAVELWFMDPDETLYFAGRYEYHTTNPKFAQYVVPSLGTTIQTTLVKALCRRKIRPVVSGDEELIFDNLEAYRLGLMAMAREETVGGLVEAGPLWSEALQCLRDQNRIIHGQSAAKPVVNVVGDTSTTGSGSIPVIM